MKADPDERTWGAGRGRNAGGSRTARRRGAGCGDARGEAHCRRCAQARRSRAASLRARVRRAERTRRVARDARRDGRGVEGARSCAARGIAHGGQADSRIRQAADAEAVERCIGARSHGWTACAPAWLGRLLCAQRAASVAFDAADDGNSRAGGGSRTHRCGFAQARAGDSGRGALARHHGVLSAGRRACRGRVGLRNREHCRAWTRSWGRGICT